jgi:serine protease SohB
MNHFYEFISFLFKALTILICVLTVISVIFAQKKKSQDDWVFECLNEKLHKNQHKIIKKFNWKGLKKEFKKLDILHLPKAFILEFNGDIKASQTNQFREEIDLILSIAKPGDEVMIKIQSPGGAVTGYGLAAAQIERLRHQHIYTNVCIDQVAASGGYLMSAVANKIYAAPFAIIGSIGVIAQLPNLNKWLKKHNIDFEQITAGKFKRTLTVFGENTDEGREKFTQDLELIHQNFKYQVHQYRPQLDIEAVATGEHWLARDAINLGLIDELKTSDDWILERLEKFQLIFLRKATTQTMLEKIIKPASKLYSQYF